MINEAQQRAQQNRNTIFVEDGTILTRDGYPGDQFVMRIRAPKCAAASTAGSFVHLSCDESLPMRRPMSVMRTREDWIEILYKTVGQGLKLLSLKQPGDSLSVLGPIGRPFRLDPDKPNALLIGGGVGIPPMVFLADTMRKDSRFKPVAVLGSEIPFPFDIVPSRLPFNAIDAATDGTMPLLESWGVPTRLTSMQAFDACFRGYVTDLARRWLDTADEATRQATNIYTCGPTPMLKAVAALAEEYGVACQVSLEEFMACAVGGCAGCAVRVNLADGPAMQRVCVDGPVFDARVVDWDAHP
ncbi:MAG: dihydroorotate dehydrogenase electron transfer subunit [Pseudomonadota bacterium]